MFSLQSCFSCFASSCASEPTKQAVDTLEPSGVRSVTHTSLAASALWFAVTAIIADTARIAVKAAMEAICTDMMSFVLMALLLAGNVIINTSAEMDYKLLLHSYKLRSFYVF